MGVRVYPGAGVWVTTVRFGATAHRSVIVSSSPAFHIIRPKGPELNTYTSTNFETASSLVMNLNENQPNPSVALVEGADSRNSSVWVLMNCSVQKFLLLRRWTQSYLVCCMLVFCVAAFGKFTSDLSNISAEKRDPFLTWMTNRELMIGAGLLELSAVIMLAVLSVKNLFKGVLVALWICSIFVVYRVGFYLSPEVANTCKCFGAGSLLGKMEARLEAASLLILGAMFLGAVSILIWSYLWTSKFNRLAVAGSVILVGFCNSAVFAEETFQPVFKVEGIIRGELKSKGKAPIENVSSFIMGVDDRGRWKLSWKDYVIRYGIQTTEEIAYDGTNIFSVLYSDKRLDKNSKVVTNLAMEVSEHPARVSRGPFPIDYGERVGTLWIAFLAGEYVSQYPNDRIPNLLIANARKTPLTWSTDFSFKLLGDSPNPLISRGSFVQASQKPSADLLDYPEVDEPDNVKDAQRVEESLRVIRQEKQPLKVESSFSLDESRMVGGRRIPTRFKSVYIISDGSGEIGVRTISCEVTNILERSVPEVMLPKLVGKIAVQDRRFKQRTKTEYLNNIFYTLDTSGWIASTNDTRLVGASGIYKGQLHKRRAVSATQKTFSTAFKIIFGLLVIGVPIVLVKTMLRNRQENQH